MSLLSAQERLSAILLAKVLDVPNVFLGALPLWQPSNGRYTVPLPRDFGHSRQLAATINPHRVCALSMA